MMFRGAAAAVAVATCVVATGCGRPTDGPGQTSSTADFSSGTTTSVPGAEIAPVPTAAPAFGYTPELEAVTGGEGTVTYDVHLPQVSGGVLAARNRFNDGMRAALRDLIDAVPSPATNQPISISDGNGPETSRVVMIGPHVVAGIQLYRWQIGDGHPTPAVSTFVINSDTAQPITYDDLFPNQFAALERLRQLLSELDSTGRLRGAGINGPFQQWLPVPTGLRFYVSVSRAAGDVVPVTVPWDRIRDLVFPELVSVLSQ